MCQNSINVAAISKLVMMIKRVILYGLFLNCFVAIKSQANFFLTKQYSSNSVWCVTNSSFALSWIDVNIQETLHYNSNYLPETVLQYNIENDHNTITYFTNNFWSIQDAQQIPFNEPLLDERWEEMEVIKTEFVSTDGKKLKYVKLANIISRDFNILLSIRIQREAHIFLCDGASPPTSNCYWFLLQAFSGKASSIRKCQSGYIKSKQGDYPEKPCSLRKVNIEHPYVPNFLSSQKWSHFIVSKRDNILSFSQFINNEKKILLEWKDDEEEVISVTDVIVHSKMVNGLWKLHNPVFIYTNQESQDVQLGPTLNPKKSSLCISVYVLMCSSCKLTLSLKYNNQEILNQKTYENEKPSWTQIRFITDNIPLNKRNWLVLHVSTIGQSQDRFWAIDKFRICNKTEFRYIGLSTKAACQLISPSDDVISLDMPSPSSAIQNLCPEDTIGEFCVQCNQFYDNCQQVKTCSTGGCQCSTGYQGEDCYYGCDKGWYGQNCQNKCGKCYYTYYYDYCDKKNGNCPYPNQCTDNYSGLKCDIPPAIIFKQAPQIVNTSYTEATIVISNFETENSHFSKEPHSYIVEYKKADSVKDGWINLNNTYNFGTPIYITIGNLESETKYFVRGVIILTSGELQSGSHIKYSEFTTKCEEISDDNILSVTTNTTVLVSLTELTKTTCKSYTISITGIQVPEYSNSSATYFTRLQPFTDYIINVQGKYQTHEKKITTDEGVPTSVVWLQVNALSNFSAHLQWQKPANINGKFTHYVVDYQRTGYVACGSQYGNPEMKTKIQVYENFANIDNLTPYSVYSFEVYAVNTKFDGIKSTKSISTPYSNNVVPEEIPKGLNITATSNSAILKLQMPNCKEIRGPLILKSTITCTSEWCTNGTRNPRTETKNLNRESIEFFDLEPFSEYNIDFNVCRENGNSCKMVQRKEFKTKPGVPGTIDQLLIYTKNETSVSLRWKPPYPPTGILEGYNIAYKLKYYSSNYKQQIQNITPCKLWSDFHCGILSNLETNKIYEIQIQAKNQDVSKYGYGKTVETITKIDKSNPPYDLKIHWSTQNNLNLEWKHPNQTNGNIKRFDIEISEKKNIENFEKQLYEDMYNLTYYLELNSTNFVPTTRYEIRVSAYNNQKGQRVSQISTSPPDIPNLLNDSVNFASTNDTITVSISEVKIRGYTDRFRLVVLRSDKKTNFETYPEIQQYDLGNLGITLDCKSNSLLETYTLTLGNGSLSKPSNCENLENSPLKPATDYNITIILLNSYQNETRSSIYSYRFNTTGDPLPSEFNSGLLGLLILLFVIPLIILLYIKRHELESIKNNLFKESNNISTEVLEVQDDHIPLSHVADNVPTPKKPPKIQPKPSIDPNKIKSTTEIHSRVIKIMEFEEYVKESIKNGELERQHALFPRGQTKPWKYGSLKENKSKNRYNNLIAYDHTRVVLQKIDGQPNSDYINANYIDGHKIQKAYIATQGPKVATLNDFWRMIWQENIRHIANLANIYEGGKKKLEKYWPDINETLQFGDIKVQYTSHKVFADYEHRVFTVTCNDESRKLEQLHFSSWPDHGVPLYSQSLVPFLQKMLQIPLNSKSPVLVHCSAGVGRTGTVLLCDICLRMAAREGTVDPLRNLQLLRDQRANMVDNIEQYKLAHLVILECLVGLHTSIPCSDIEHGVQKMLINGSLTLQMKYLEDTQWQDQAMKTVANTGEDLLVVREKNRFENIIPEIQGRVFISRSPPEDQTSSYINAIKVDGFRNPGRFIVTQQPMPNTLGDFWRLINENTTGLYAVVVSLNEIDPKDRTSCSFWPTATTRQMTPAPKITLKYINTVSVECYNVITIHLYSDSWKEFLPVQIISFKNWSPNVNCPKSIEGFLSCLEESESTSRGTNSVYVTCYDGVKASGLYVAMSFMIEKMKLEQVCDVCQAVRNIRHNRRQFVQELEQFEFLYNAAVVYINGFQSYANFN